MTDGDLRCHGAGCEETTPLSVDVARGRGWRVSWTPGGPVWCPKCWKPPQVRTPAAAVQPWDVPLFEEL